MDVLDLPSLWGKRLLDAVSLNLNGLQVEGNFVLDRTTIHGTVLAKGLQIEQNANIRGCEINSSDPKNIDAVTLDNARIGGDFNFGCWAPHGSYYGKNGAYRESLVRGSVSATNIRVNGTVNIIGLQVLGDFSCWGSVFESTVFIAPFMKQADDGVSVVAHTMVSGQLSFAAAKISGHLKIESTRVDGLLSLLSLESGTIVLGIFEYPSPAETGPCILGGLTLKNARIHGDVQMPMLVVTGSDQTKGSPGLFINGADIEGDILFWRSNLQYKNSAGSSNHSIDFLTEGAFVGGHLEICQSNIRGECDFVNVTVAGVVRLNDSHIAGDIAFRSRTTLLASYKTPKMVRDRLPDSDTKLRRATAANLDLTMVRCDNDIDLTGLDLISERPDAEYANELLDGVKVGCVVARGLQAQGEVELFAINDEFNITDSVNIPGAADFRYLKAFRFVISHNSFDAETFKECDIDRIGLRLTSAELGELRIEARSKELKRRRLFGGRTERFPRPLHLQDLSVRAWDIRNYEQTDKFQTLLSCDPMFRRDTYVRSEQSVRNAGHESEANAIYRAAQWRARRQVWRDAWRSKWWFFRLPLESLRGIFLHLPFALLLGYGTTPLRLLLIIGVVWGMMMPFYGTRENFEPSLAYREVRAAEGLAPLKIPPADIWQDATPFFVSLRYHIPIIGLVARDEWELAEETGLSLFCKTAPHLRGSNDLQDVDEKPKSDAPLESEASKPDCWLNSSLKPKDVGIIISLLNWALWPLVLTFSIRKMLR
ncbi:MAG: hypothetical protein JMN25_17520 [gamma proteobacterium endosymbiont of Lamellibrachia anaximandri]|nr:hypothetical protein [gamma proteobacterium endosymbiont of Lamellibrachia anaximandri]